ADKNLENDEPLFISSSSDDDDDEDEPIREAASQPINPRKRPAGGHTPLDLARCQKVKNLLNSQSPKSSRHVSKKIRASSEEAEASGLDEDTLSRLVEVLSVEDAPWKKLAEKLGMLTLTHLYQDSPTPPRHLLQHYKLGGGPVDGLVEALHSLGLKEGVRLLRNTERQDDKHSTDAHVDSGFGSQPMEEEEPAVANQ
ncbi:nuclear factor NF-kappa-B p100 subunit, partial [Scomber scombrus]